MEDNNMSELKHILGPMRPPFLLLAVACVLLGLGTAVWTSGEVSVFYFILTLIGGVAAHVSVNAFNEYYDFKSGLDFRTKRTPFSGGSGTLPEKPELARQALITAIIAFVITGLIGLYFFYVRGWLILPLGILGLIVVFIYTTLVTRNPVLCLIAPGLGFGILMVMGTDFALTGHYSWTAFIASLVPFFLVSDLLLLNQFPDVEADQSIGRKHFPITLGRRASSFIFGAFLLLANLTIVVGVSIGYLPVFSLIGLVVFVLAVPVFIGAYRYAEDIEKLTPYLGMNVVINLATPVLVAIGLFIG
jgi:1,4-dihydroxy-2-naphthoate octaprenyltransferase